MRRTTLFLVTSLCINVAMGIVLSRGRSAHSPIEGSTLDAGDGRAQAADIGSPLAYFTYLRGLGLSVDETKPIILSGLDRRSLPDAKATPTDRYWESELTGKYLANELAVAEKREAVRTALISIYGAEAAHDDLFKSVFRPLDARYGFLTSAEQVAFQQFQLQRQLDQLANRRVQSPASSGMPTARRMPNDQTSMAELGKVLQPQSVAEVLYRYSPLAEQIRSARVQFSEAEYRQTFDQLQRLNQGSPPSTTYVDVRDALRRLLGTDRLTRLWAARDPLYGAIEGSASQLGLTEETALAAYEILIESQERIAKATTLRSVDPARSRAQMQEAVNAQQERLAGLLGRDVAQQVLRIQSQLSLQLRSESTGARGVAP